MNDRERENERERERERGYNGEKRRFFSLGVVLVWDEGGNELTPRELVENLERKSWPR